MSWLRLGLWLWRRERGEGEWRVLLFALLVGVGSVATTGFLGDRLKRAMTEQGAEFLGADLLVTSPRLITSWPPHSLATSHAVEFASMVSHADAFQLATVRAVDASHPLRGTVRIAAGPYATSTARPALPPPGAVYVEAALLPLLAAEVGDTLTLGAASFRIAGVIAESPGQLGGVFGLAPRVFLRADELAATRVVLPGSRVTHLYQFAGPSAAVDTFAAAIKPDIDASQRLVGAREGTETLRGAFANLDRYLQLSALISLLLALVAIAIAARRHALRHIDQAALLRCFGATAAQLRLLYTSQLIGVGLVGSILGVALGAGLQHGLAVWLLPGTAGRLPGLGWTPVWAACASGLLGLLGASLPALLRLAQVPPLRVLRRELPPWPRSARFGVGIAMLAVLLLIGAYANDLRLFLIFVAALAGLVLILASLARFALWAGRGLRRISSGPLRFGLAQLLRHRIETSLQLGAFTLALFLIALLALARGDLVAGWRQQLPAEAPNYFLVNIAPQQEAEVAAFLAQHQLRASTIYPMVRGRLVRKNGVPIAATLAPDQRDSPTLRRELNLTWSADLPANNVILDGAWHGARQAAEISVESGMAARLGLAVGDVLEFAMADQAVSARIGSLRSVAWDSLQPNFFVIFAPGQLDHLSASAIASVHVPPAKAGLLPAFVQRFPGVTLLALDKLIADLEAVFAQLVGAVQLLLGFLLAAGLAVVMATLLASLDARTQEAVLLRTLGAERAYLARGLISEFVVLGLVAGLLASLGAELAMAAIAERLFDLPPRWHPGLWLALPLAGAILISASGWLITRRITRVPPMQSIRTLA